MGRKSQVGCVVCARLLLVLSTVLSESVRVSYVFQDRKLVP